MRAEDYEFLFEMEESYWWFVGMRHITDSIIATQLNLKPLQILDAGCGTGYNLQHYGSAGHSVFGFDLAREAIQMTQRRDLANVARASITAIPYASETFDLVLSFEVLDEVPAPASDAAVSELYRVLRPGGFLFLRVPAFEWLRSSHDADIGTTHRFTVAELREKLTRAGFTVRLATYANTLLFPAVVVRRLLKRLGIGKGTDTKPLPSALAWLDPLLRGLLESEAAMIRQKGPLPFGLSAICYAQKPTDIIDDRRP